MKKSMTRQRLGQYSHLQSEIVMLEGQILTAEIKGEEYLTDIVQGSSAAAPYTKRSVAIQGYGSRAIPRLSKQKARYEAECDAIERYIESVEDSRIRQLLTRRYIEGRQLKEAAPLANYSYSQAKRLLKELFEKDAP